MLDSDRVRLSAALRERYRIERELGRGGMATIYLAEDVRHARRVAIKVLRPELATTLGHGRFLREIGIAAKLAHPHILTLIDSGEADGLLYYVMPYVEGESLRVRLDRERQLPLEKAIEIVGQIGDALDYAHGLGIVHRDIKPENILFEAGHAVVADFGIAMALSAAGARRLTETGLLLGTPAYMSPEQAAGGHEIDSRSDIYALACVLYEMLVGDPPFPGSSVQAVLTRKLTQPAPPLRAVRRTVPENVERALQRALATAPPDRFRTAQEFVSALTAEGRSAHRNRRRMIAAAGVVGIAILTLGTWLGLEAPDGFSPIERLAVLPLANLTGDAEQEYFVAGMHDALIAELARIHTLTVISRQSVLRYKESDRSVSEIARALSVDAIVEGSVFRAGDTVRINAQLVRALPAERHLWAGSYEKDLRNVLAAHAEVASAIANEINATLTESEQARLSGAAAAVDPESYTLYLKGNFQLANHTEAAFRRALRHFQNAIAIDSTYAPAHAGLAMAYIELGSWSASLPPGAVHAPARAAAVRALELDPDLAEAHIALGRIQHLFEWDWAGADAAFRRGIALNPGATHALYTYANYLASTRRFQEAVTIGREMVARDPLSSLAHFTIGFALGLHGRSDEALIHYERAANLPVEQLGYYLDLAGLYAARGRPEDALSYAQRAEHLLGDSGSPLFTGRLAATYIAIGRRAEGLRIVKELEERAEQEFVTPFAFVHIYLALGEPQKVLDLLEQGYEERDVLMVWLNVWPESPSIRSDPRFQRLLERMNFPE